jgi:hypothetical protein
VVVKVLKDGLSIRPPKQIADLSWSAANGRLMTHPFGFVFSLRSFRLPPLFVMVPWTPECQREKQCNTYHSQMQAFSKNSLIFPKTSCIFGRFMPTEA